jgi:ubiquinone/menaquinone biosynthesis C-methylase UbiE
MTEVKQEVRQFYDQVGWQLVSEDIYQNARYEDLRPVAREYIHRCHLRVARHIKPSGYYLLDAGSGPVQYPEYLDYAHGYRYRVCADISITALLEARKRVGESGLYVVADIASLPFKQEAFDGLVSLHTIHHLPEEEHLQAYRELHRVLAAPSQGVVVNGWPSSRLMKAFEPLVKAAQRIRYVRSRLGGRGTAPQEEADTPAPEITQSGKAELERVPKGTFTSRHDVAWVKNELGKLMEVEILVWRSVSVRFLRALIHPRLGGRLWLRLLFWLEERFPHFFGENGKYPLIVIRKV